MAEPRLLLAQDGANDYRIVISASASPSERHGAHELRGFLEQICGARLPIITDAESLGRRDATERFSAAAERGGVTHIRESSRHQSTMEDFRRELGAGSQNKRRDDADVK